MISLYKSLKGRLFRVKVGLGGLGLGFGDPGSGLIGV